MYQPPGNQPPFQGPPGGQPPFFPGQPPQKNNTPVIAAIGCVVLVVLALLVVVVIVALEKNDDDKKTVVQPSITVPPLPSLTVPVPTFSPTLPSISPAPSGYSSPKCTFGTDNTFGSECGGTWTGEIIQTKPTVLKFQATVKITAGAKDAEITYSGNGFDCTAKLVVISTVSYRATLREDDRKGKCDEHRYDTLLPAVVGGTEKMYLSKYSKQEDVEQQSRSEAIGLVTR